MTQRDIDWVEYLKAIGGPDNLKPAGNLLCYLNISWIQADWIFIL